MNVPSLQRTTADPLVSVVIPTRGRPALLLRAVRSVLAQTFASFEIVVVIDGPDQESATMLGDFADPRIRVIALPESVGGSEVRNIGARSARGRWIALLDDDDEWLPRKLQEQVAAAESAGTDQLLITCRYFYREDGRPDRIGPRLLPDGSVPLIDYLFSPGGGFQTSTFFCSKQVLLRIPFTRGLKGLQDIDWMVRVAVDGTVKVVVLPEVLSIYTAPLRRDSITQKLSWRDRFDWGRKHRSLLSRRQYALFLQQFCLRRARTDRAGATAYGEILQEALRHGAIDIRFLARSAGLILASDAMRQQLRVRLHLLAGTRA